MRSFLCVIFSIACFLDIKFISGMIFNQDHNFRVCSNNDSISLKVSTTRDVNDLENNATCQCSVESINESLKMMSKDGYRYTPGIGSHKLHLNAKTWNEARKVCNEEDAHLAVINSEAEETILLDMLNKNSDNITDAANELQAFLGIHDIFKEGEWVTVFGKSIYTTGYTKWSTVYHGGQPDNFWGQNCGSLLTIGGMDDVFCHDKFAFFCERPISCS